MGVHPEEPGIGAYPCLFWGFGQEDLVPYSIRTPQLTGRLQEISDILPLR